MRLCGKCFGDDDDSEESDGSSSEEGSDGGSDEDDDGTVFNLSLCFGQPKQPISFEGSSKPHTRLPKIEPDRDEPNEKERHKFMLKHLWWLLFTDSKQGEASSSIDRMRNEMFECDFDEFSDQSEGYSEKGSFFLKI